MGGTGDRIGTNDDEPVDSIEASDVDERANNTHELTGQQIDQSIVYELYFGTDGYWYFLIVVLVDWNSRVIRAILCRLLIFINQPYVIFGNTQPWPTDYNIYVDQNGQGAESIAVQPLADAFTFSTTVTESLPPPRESIGTEDTQPHNMPIPIMWNNMGRSRPIIGENIHTNVDVPVRTDPDEIMASTVYHEPHVPAIEASNTKTGAPTELPRDTDFSVDTSDQHNTQLDTNSDHEEQGRNNEIISFDHHENGAPDVSVGRGQASPNPNRPNQTNNNLDHPVATRTGEVLETEPNTTDATPDAHQTILAETPNTGSIVRKEPGPTDSIGELIA